MTRLLSILAGCLAALGWYAVCEEVADRWNPFMANAASGTGPVMNEAPVGLRHTVTVPFAGERP